MGEITGIHGFHRALPAEPTPTRDPGSSSANPGQPAPVGDDQVEFSDLGNTLAELRNSGRDLPARLADLRSAIAAGTYETPHRIAVVVDRLVDELVD